MQRSILIVDDIRSNRLILKEILKDEYQILEAAGGEEALDTLRREYATVSAVLLDISMPGMDGYEVLRRIREDIQLSQIPVIMITGNEGEESRVLSLANGANDYVTKPYRSDIVRHCLKNHIAFHEAAETVATLQRDNLTRLYTRETFFEKAREMVDAQEPGYYVMASFDIDKFKVINDQYGTAMGDRVLLHTAKVFRDGFGKIGGICSRIAGDDFAVLYPAHWMDTDALRSVWNSAMWVDGLTAPVAFCVGRYIVDDKTMAPSAMLDRAVLTADSIKGRYDTRIALYTDELHERLIREQEIVADMAQALAERQFEVWYQPQYNHSTDAMVGAEALVRWRHPRKGIIPPDAFIPIFERNGFVYMLDKFVWEEVCRSLRKWLDEGRNPLPVSVNISRYGVFQEDLADVLGGLVERYDLPFSLLRLEVTESAFAKDGGIVIAAVRTLLDMGFTVEIDDFGSGYSSLNTLKDVSAQILKLDMKFLESSEDSQRGGNIVESIVRMAKWLGMSVIAEGVENIRQADFLRSVGCGYMQGYLFARPMPREQYEAHCRDVSKEEHLLTLDTVENLDNNSLWDPESMDSLIFNSFVGAACILEYHGNTIEILRATELFAKLFTPTTSVDAVLKCNWVEYLDGASRRLATDAFTESAATQKPVSGEFTFLDLPNCPKRVYLRSIMRVIAEVGDRYLVYCTSENITAQREAEQRERETAEQMNTIMENVRGGISAVTFDEAGRVHFAFANARFYDILGYTREQFHAEVKNVLELVHPEDIGRIQEEMNRVMTTRKPTYYEYRCTKRDGSLLYLRCNAACTAVSGAGDNVLLSVLTDITEVIEAQKKERWATEQIKNMMNNTPGGFVRMRLMPDGGLGTAYVNESFCRMRQMSAAEILAEDGENALVACHPDDLAEALEELRACLESGRKGHVVYRLRRKDGSYIALNAYGSITKDEDGQTYVDLFYTELSSREKMDYSIRGTMPYILSTIMESSNDYAFAKDRDLRYICCSRAFLDLVGLEDEKETVGKTDFELFPADMAEQFRKNDLSLVESGKPLVDFYETIHTAEGDVIHCQASKWVLHDADGNFIGVYGVSRDISRALLQESQLRLFNNALSCGLVTYIFTADTIRIAYCNEGFLRLFGGTRAGLEARGDFDPLEWVAPEDRPLLARENARLYETGAPAECVFRIVTRSGEEKTVRYVATALERMDNRVIVNAILLDTAVK